MLDRDSRQSHVAQTAVGQGGVGDEILNSVSLVVGASSPDPRLQAFSIDTSRVEPADLLLAPLSLPPIPRDSPDDYFALKHSMVPGERSARARRALNKPLRALARYMTMEDGYLSAGADGESEPRFEVRSCDQYITHDRRHLCWVSYRDRDTEAVVVPNLSLLNVEGDTTVSEDAADTARIERFFDGEARVVITSDGDRSSMEVFATPECEREIVEHFLLAIRGAGQASFLHHLWLGEVTRFFEANGLSLVHDSVEDFVRKRTCTACVSYGCSSPGVADYLDLEVSVVEPRDPFFMSMFGARSVMCRMVFAQQDGARWVPPRWEWSVQDLSAPRRSRDL